MTRETSIAVYRQLESSGALSRLRLLVAKDVAEHGPTTQTETTSRLSEGHARRFNNTYQPRFAELRRWGVIEITGERPCRVTGRSEVEWHLTGRMPTKPPDRPTRVELERAACAKIARNLAAAANEIYSRQMALDIERQILGRGKP